jgi:hypothetical protein
MNSSSTSDIEDRKTALRIAVESSANASTADLVARAAEFLFFLRGHPPTNTAVSQVP